MSPEHINSFKSYRDISFNTSSRILDLGVASNGQSVSENKTQSGISLEDSTTTTSSPFISDPSNSSLSETEMNKRVSMDHISRDIDEVTNEFDSLRLRDRSLQSPNLETTQFNDNQSQLDLDLDLDLDNVKIVRPSYHKRGQITSRINSENLVKKSADRYLSTYSRNPDLSGPKMSLSSTMLSSKATHDSSSNAARIDELNRQVTGYKIQLKVFRQFLQSLIDKTHGNLRYGVRDIDLQELQQMTSNIGDGNPVSEISTNKVENDYQELAKSYDEIFRLNEDLYENLELFEIQLRDKSSQVENDLAYNESYLKVVDEVLHILNISDDPNLMISEKSTRDDDTWATLEKKLEILCQEVKKMSSENLKKSYPSPPSSTQREDESQGKDISLSTLSSLREEYSDYKRTSSETIASLQGKLNETEKSNTNLQSISVEHQELLTLLGGLSIDEINLIKRDNERLNAMIKNVDSRFNEYEKVIYTLHKELARLRNENSSVDLDVDANIDETISKLKDDSRVLVDKELREHSSKWKKDFEQLNAQLDELNEEYINSKKYSAQTIEKLTKSLNSKQEEIKSLRKGSLQSESLRDKLENEREKQRVLKAEKIRLTYDMETLRNEKTSLQCTIKDLTDEMATIARENISRDKDPNLHIYREQFMRLFKFDIYGFQKLLKSFNKIADDLSLKEPARKTNVLCQKLDVQDQVPLGQDWFDMVNEYHRSTYEYFLRAVDIIVIDHVKLLLKESDTTAQNNNYITKLQRRIDELNALNEALALNLDKEPKTPLPTDTGRQSPIYKLRIEELTNRWKAEREARVYESHEAKTRFHELQEENERLRRMLTKH